MFTDDWRDVRDDEKEKRAAMRPRGADTSKHLPVTPSTARRRAPSRSHAGARMSFAQVLERQPGLRELAAQDLRAEAG